MGTSAGDYIIGVENIAAVIRRSSKTAGRLLRAGKLPATKRNGVWRMSRKVWDRSLERAANRRVP